MPAGAATQAEVPGGRAGDPAQAVTGQVVKGDHEKLGRNQPCWCGSGKKFKMCHGR
jgi:preprotein translocase subunit SecA